VINRPLVEEMNLGTKRTQLLVRRVSFHCSHNNNITACGSHTDVSVCSYEINFVLMIADNLIAANKENMCVM
jgi:transposase